jgi:hypothetical protein
LTCHSFSKGTIEVIVGGTNPATFHVHEALVSRSSEYFRRALSREWTESCDRQVRLAEQEPDVFNFYLNWLYQCSLRVRNESAAEMADRSYPTIAKSYVLGDYLQDIAFRSAIIDAFAKKPRMPTPHGVVRYPGPLDIHFIYGHTTRHSKFRSLLVQIYMKYSAITSHMKRVGANGFPSQFLHDLAISLLDERPPQGIVSIDSRQYHETCPAGPAASKEDGPE